LVFLIKLSLSQKFCNTICLEIPLRQEINVRILHFQDLHARIFFSLKIHFLPCMDEFHVVGNFL